MPQGDRLTELSAGKATDVQGVPGGRDLLQRQEVVLAGRGERDEEAKPERKEEKKPTHMELNQFM